MLSTKNQSATFRDRYHASRFRLSNSLPLAFISYFLAKALSAGEEKLLSLAVTPQGLKYGLTFFIGAFIAWAWADIRDDDSLIEYIINRIRNGVVLSLNVGLAKDQSKVKDGYQRVYIYQSIVSCRTGRCEDRYNTIAYFRVSPLFKEDGRAYFLGRKVEEFIIRDKVDCIDGLDSAETALVELLLPENLENDVFYKLKNCPEFGSEYKVFPKNQFLSLSVRCTGKRKIFSTSEEDALTIHFNKDTSSMVELIGGAGDYECRSCGVGKIRAKHLDSFSGQGILNFK